MGVAILAYLLYKAGIITGGWCVFIIIVGLLD